MRITKGIPVTSINWGPWADVGMAAGWVSSNGIHAASADEYLSFFENAVGAASQTCVMAVDWSVFSDYIFSRRDFYEDVLPRAPSSRVVKATSAFESQLLAAAKRVSSAGVAALVTDMVGPGFATTTGAQVPIDGGSDRVI